MSKEQKQILLYGPMEDKDLKRQYPELLLIKEFSALGARDLLFVWWLSNPTSPIVLLRGEDEHTKRTLAIKQVYGKTITGDKLDSFTSGNFPEKIKLAIERMRLVEPGIRAKAKMMTMKMMENFEKMVEVDMDDFDTIVKEPGTGKIISRETNFTARNNYINSCAKISETLPNLIKQSEEGFGIVEVGESDMPNIKAIDKFHSQKKEEN